MALKSMKITKTEKKERTSDIKTMENGPDFPWGLRLRLGTDELEKLGITDLPKLQKEMRLIAVVKVVEISQHQSENHKNTSLELQITEMELSGVKKSKAEVLFGKA